MSAIVIRMSNIFGDSIPGYGDQIEAVSYAHGIARPANDPRFADRIGNAPQHQDFVVTKYIDVASPRLNQVCSQGLLFDEVTVQVGLVNSGAVQPLITYTMSDVMITAVTTSAGGDTLIESVSMNYTRIRWETAGKRGPIVGSWDLEKNAPG